MNSEEYAEKLKDVRWERARNFILRRDDYTCQECGAKAGWGYELHAHHKRYISGREPWEYWSTDLITLCKRCHCKEHGIEYEQQSHGVHVSIPLAALMKRLKAIGNAGKGEV